MILQIADKRLLRVFILLCIGWMFSFGVSSAQQRQQSVNPHGKLPANLSCNNCHTEQGWTPLRDPLNFNHDKQTRFPLVGRHSIINCQSCHLNLKFDKPTFAEASDCEFCHVDVHQGKMIHDCQACHSQQTFNLVDGRSVHLRTNFPLTGAHQQIACESCHSTDRNGAFVGLDTDCYSCHEQDYRNARSVDHLAQGFPTNCEQCHNTMGWATSSFDHAMVSGGYELVGAHSMIRCESCHQVPSLTLKFHPADQNDCFTCHEADYQHEHAGSGFPTTCQSCHNQTNWEGAEFDHAAVSGGFELVGAHDRIECSSCHIQPSNDLRFPGVTDINNCIGCHQADYDREHSGSGFPTTCLTCHNTDTWDDAEFDHTEVSGGFELVGAHDRIDCSSCHIQPGNELRFAGVTDVNNCIGCHQDDYDREHSGSGFSTQCTDCHTTDSWDGAEFTDHDAQYFPIYSGTHNNTWNSCQTCHTDPGNYASFTCLDCHEHNETDMNNKHREVSGYSYLSTACLSCHPTGGEGGDDD